VILKKGTEVTQIEVSKTDPGWIYVSYDKYKGYISELALKESSAKDKYASLDGKNVKNTISSSSYTAAVKGFAKDYTDSKEGADINLDAVFDLTYITPKDVIKLSKTLNLTLFPKKGDLIGDSKTWFNQRVESIALAAATDVLRKGLIYDSDRTKTHMSITNHFNRSTVDYDHYYYTFIINDTEPVAYSGPGGYIFISNKMLDILNEQQVIAVIAHEIGHIALRHGFKDLSLELLRESTDEAFGELDTELDSDTREISDDLETVIGEAVKACQLVRDDKEEYEADQVAVELLRRYKVDRQNLIQALTKTYQQLKSEYPDYRSQLDKRIKKIKESQ
jgi:putative metalloprotease